MGSNMTRPILLVAMALVLAASPSRAEESVLKLVPTDAAAFVHIRFGEIWKDDSLKATRDYLTKTQPDLLRKFQGEFGFGPADVERVTVIVPEFSKAGAIGEPVIVVRLEKAFDKGKLLAAMKAVTPGEPIFHMPPSRPVAPPPMFKKEAPRRVPVPKSDFPKPPPPSKDFKDDKFQIAFQGVPEEEPDRFPTPKPNVRAHHFMLPKQGFHLHLVDDRTLLFVPENEFSRGPSAAVAYGLQLLRGRQHGPLSGALAEAGKKHVVVGGLDIEALAKALPEGEDLGPIKGLLGAKAAALTLDLGEELKAQLSINAWEIDTAKKVEDAVKTLMETGKMALPAMKKELKDAPVARIAKPMLDLAEKVVGNAKVTTKDSTVQVSTSFRFGDFLDQLLDALKHAYSAPERIEKRISSQRSLSLMGVALFTQQDENGYMNFGGIGGKKDAPNLSWRVALLPFLDEKELYDQFRLDEPWDSEHNKKLIEKMPKVYAPASGIKVEKGHTFYQVFTGPDAIQPIMSIPKSFPDGASTTILVIEAGEAVPWTKPGGIPYDPKKPLPKLGGIDGGDFNILLGDGSVRFVPMNIPEKVLRALITPASNDVTDWDWDK